MRFSLSGVASVSLLLAISALVAGCATNAQRQVEQISGGLESAYSSYQACMGAAYNDPNYADLRTSLPLTAQQATLSQMTNERKATPEEVYQLTDLYPKQTACRRGFVEQTAMVAPSLVPIMAETFDRADKRTVDLVQRRITWAEYISQWKASASTTQAETSAAMRQIGAGLEVSHQQELMQRQAAAQAIGRGLAASAAIMQNQQAINAMNRPVMTNCTRFGNSVNCISN